MRFVWRDINVYFRHTTLTLENVRGAIYGASDHPSLLPIGRGVEAYDVLVESIE